MELILYLTDKKEVDITEDLILRAKNTNILVCYFLDENDNAVDITGDELYFMVKDKSSAVTAKINKKITTFTNPTGGEHDLELTNIDTANLLGNYLWQLKIKHESKWYTLKEGNITFRKSIILRES